MAKNEIDMLHGPLLKKILLFALPLAASSLLQQLFNSMDIAVVGLLVGDKALAAVGSCAPVIGLFINMMVGLSLGANAVISNHIGRGDQRAVRHAVSTVARLSLWCGLAVAAIGLLSAPEVLRMMGTPDEVMAQAVGYLRIFFLGVPFLSVFNFASAILRSMGDTRRPLYILAAAGVLNVVLNLTFVTVFHMGVSGVAIATCVANLVSALASCRLLLKEKEPFRLRLSAMRPYREQLAPILQIGVPAGVQGMVFSFSNIVVQSAINSYGTAAMAGSAAALNFEQYCYFLIQAFAGAAISFTAQNYGAGQMDRVRLIFRQCMGLAVVCCGLFNVLFVWQDHLFLRLFTTDAPVAAFGATRMHIVLLLQWMACSYEISASCMRGMGHSLVPALITVFGTCVLRVAWVVFADQHWHSFTWLMAIYPLTWLVTGSLMLLAYRQLQRKASLPVCA